MADKIDIVIFFFLNAARRNAIDLAVLVLVLATQAGGVYILLQTSAARGRLWLRRLIMAAGGVSGLAVILAFLLVFQRVMQHFSVGTISWFRGLTLIWSMLTVMWMGAWIFWRLFAAILTPAESETRRGFMKAAGAALFAAPLAVTGYGVFVQRLNIHLREQKIVIPGLPQDFDGLRLVQLTDIHLSPFLSERDLARAVAMANETNAHLALVTGDMITMRGDPLDTCLKHLAELHSEAGILGCLGNHEVYAQAQDYATEQGARLGIRYLRSEAVRLKFGGATMNIAGVDYQQMHKLYLKDADKLVVPDMFNVLLSHNPDVFPKASRQGYDLTIAGHTHGGQVRVEILREDLNIARFFTPYVDGLYQEGAHSIFVSRGIGTIGLPARLGSPPEVALLRLCRS